MTPAFPPRGFKITVVQPGQAGSPGLGPNKATYNDDMIDGWVGVGSQIDCTHVLVDAGLAGQPAPRRQALALAVAQLRFAQLGQILGPALDAVLGEAALLRLALAGRNGRRYAGPRSRRFVC